MRQQEQKYPCKNKWMISSTKWHTWEDNNKKCSCELYDSRLPKIIKLNCLAIKILKTLLCFYNYKFCYLTTPTFQTTYNKNSHSFCSSLSIFGSFCQAKRPCTWVRYAAKSTWKFATQAFAFSFRASSACPAFSLSCCKLRYDWTNIFI